MHVALVFDMEGTSHIGNPRETFPMYREYWDAGRVKLTNDVVAAASGLLDGGATEVFVMNHHGAGDEEWPNVLVERFPDHVRTAEAFGKRAMRDHVDAMFQVGAHARGGSRSFMSHTLSPELRLRLNGELLCESHWWAFTGAVPLLGIVGSTALGAERGSLGDVPFLAVQAGHDRESAAPVFSDPESTAAAIRMFATAAARGASERRSCTPPGPIRLEASLPNADSAEPAMTAGGWRRTSPTEFTIEAPAWRTEAETIDDSIYAAAGAAFGDLEADWLGGFDPSSEASALAFPPERLAQSDAIFRFWLEKPTPEWFAPEVEAHRLDALRLIPR